MNRVAPNPALLARPLPPVLSLRQIQHQAPRAHARPACEGHMHRGKMHPLVHLGVDTIEPNVRLRQE
eukprot:3371820-Rhodomonas_salina.1